MIQLLSIRIDRPYFFNDQRKVISNGVDNPSDITYRDIIPTTEQALFWII